jgi:hypothetical protein
MSGRLRVTKNRGPSSARFRRESRPGGRAFVSAVPRVRLYAVRCQAISLDVSWNVRKFSVAHAAIGASVQIRRLRRVHRIECIGGDRRIGQYIERAASSGRKFRLRADGARRGAGFPLRPVRAHRVRPARENEHREACEHQGNRRDASQQVAARLRDRAGGAIGQEQLVSRPSLRPLSPPDAPRGGVGPAQRVATLFVIVGPHPRKCQRSTRLDAVGSASYKAPA